MRWAWLLALVLLTTGCLNGAGNDSLDPGDSSMREGETERIERETTFEEEITLASTGQGRIEEIEWSTPLGPGLVSLNVELTWEQGANNFGLDVERPDGSVFEIEPEQDPTLSSLEADVPDVDNGSYTFYPTRTGAVAMDTITLRVSATLEVPVGEDVTLQGCSSVTVEQTSNGYRASYTCQATGEESAQRTVDADTGNGAISIDGANDANKVLVEAWARGDTESQARDRVETINVNVKFTRDEIVAHAEAQDWNNRGANADLMVPSETTLSGQVDTSNGPIDFSSLRTDGFQASTSNGPIQGDITGHGDITLDTSNGAMDLAFEPQDDATLTTTTSNGPITLALTEASVIAYTLDAETSNGEISESMDEAHLDGGDQDATLVTENGDDRATQVTGTTDTSNGNIQFQSG